MPPVVKTDSQLLQAYMYLGNPNVSNSGIIKYGFTNY